MKTNSINIIIKKVLSLPKHKDLKVAKQTISHPLTLGFRKSIGDPTGQKADYRLILFDNRSIHIKEYDEYYLIHWDERDPDIDIIGHLIEDAPHWLCMFFLAFVGFLGLIYYWKYSKDENDNRTL